MNKQPIDDTPENIRKLPAWARVYLASRERLNIHAPDMQRSKGRPQRNTPVQKTTIYLSPDDKNAVLYWQIKFSEIAERKVSLGETVALLARTSRDRLDTMGGVESFTDMESILSALLEVPDVHKDE
ncbi:MAG: hypothetical protein MUO76_18000 [Anaerolineaceae bacterium]|nr:hypothetical protein [Anaerolineaceae bacterium]